MVERCNKEIMRHLRALIFEIGKRSSWPSYLPIVRRIMNTQVHPVTGVSPNALMIPTALDHDDSAALKGKFENPRPSTMTEYVSDLYATQCKLILIAQQRQINKDIKHVEVKTLEKYKEFPVNSYVTVSYPDGAMGPRPPSKLHTQRKGPMRVVRFELANYTLRDLIDSSEHNVHVSRLAPFLYDPTRTDPAVIAAADNEEDFVDRILEHSGSPSRKSDMDFLVRWSGYDESHDMWIPWKELRLNPALHTYLRENNMASIIPKEHRYTGTNHAVPDTSATDDSTRTSTRRTRGS